MAATSGHQAAVARNGARLTVVLAEAVLHQQVGGAETMAGQLTCLTGQGSTSLTVQVLPFSQGAHAFSGCGPLTIVRLGEVSGLGMVRVPDLSGGHCLTSPAEVACHVKAFTAVRGQALTVARSRQLISDIAAGHAVRADRWLMPGRRGEMVI